MDNVLITIISYNDIKIRKNFINEQEERPTIIKTSIKLNWTKILNGIILESKYFKMIRRLIETEIRIGKINSKLIYPTITKEIVEYYKFSPEDDSSPIIRWGKKKSLTSISQIERIIHYDMYTEK